MINEIDKLSVFRKGGSMQSEEKKKEKSPAQILIRENLFTTGPDGKPKLIVSQCKDCGGTFYPLEMICPSCIKEGTLQTKEIDGRAKIVAFTKVSRGLPGYDSPYVLACLEIEEGPCVIAQLEGWHDVPLVTGMKAELVIGKIKENEKGQTIIGPKYKPLP
jgi:uncharacterized OB-fold protein